jgi:hypothetical protein
MKQEHVLGGNIARFGNSFFCGMCKLKEPFQTILDKNTNWESLVEQEADRLIKVIDSNSFPHSADDKDKDKVLLEKLKDKLSHVYRIELPLDLNEKDKRENKDLEDVKSDKETTDGNNVKEGEKDTKESIWEKISKKRCLPSLCTSDKCHIDGTDFRILNGKEVKNKKEDTRKYKDTWEYKVNSRIEMQTLFTDGFINSFNSTEELKSKKNTPYQNIAHYRIYVQEKIPVFIDDDNIVTTAFVDYIDYMVRPNNVLIVSLKTDNYGKSLDEIADIQHRIQMINWYTENGEFGHSSLAYLFLFYPILYLTSLHNAEMKMWEKRVKSAFHRIFIGNKFYVYSVTQLNNRLYNPETLLAEKEESLIEKKKNNDIAEIEQKESEYFDYALYGLGKLIDVDTMLQPHSYFYPNIDYYHKVMNDNVLKIYDNWRALALNETFTVLCDQTLRKGELEEMVTSRYKLFVSVVYQKTFIFYENMYFQNESISQDMEDEILEFNRFFNITLPTYNEVPLMFYNKMREAMGVVQVYDVLSDKITTSTRQQSERRERSFNGAVGFLAVFAIFSAAIDYISLLKTYHGRYYLPGWNIHILDIFIVSIVFIVMTLILFRIFQVMSVSKTVVTTWEHTWNSISSFFKRLWHWIKFKK